MKVHAILIIFIGPDLKVCVDRSKSHPEMCSPLIDDVCAKSNVSSSDIEKVNV